LTEKPHQIRLSRREIKQIERLASEGMDDDGLGAADLGHVPPLRRRRSLWSRCSHALISICILLAFLGGAGFIVLRNGVDSELLRNEAQTALGKILGEGASTSIASAALSLDQNNHVAMEARDVSIIDPGQGVKIEGIRSVRLGLAPLPLLTGKLRVAQLEVEGFAYDMPEAKGDGFWKSLPYADDGTVDFDAVSGEIFAVMRRSLELLRQQDTRSISIFNSTIRFKAGNEQESVEIRKAQLIEDHGQIVITGTVVWHGKTVALDGRIERAVTDDSLKGFVLNVNHIPVTVDPPPQVAPVIGENRVNPAHFELQGLARLSLSGKASTAGDPETLGAEFSVDGIDLQLGRVDDVLGNLRLNLEHQVGSRKLEVKESEIKLGGFQARFNGAFGPDAQATGMGEGPNYRFELLTSSATSMPAESSDPPLSFATRISGHFLADRQRIEFSNLDVKTDKGELNGQGSMTFGDGSPEMIFMLRIPQMPVADAKHLWPIDVADGAREWVLKNLFGGTMKDSRIDISLPAGKFNGPGLPPPLTGDEIKADFKVVNTRFDVVGDLPPVRDADGDISVRGAHTTIKLLKGVAYTANNRKADVTDGTLVIPWGPQRPVIADLDLGLTGEAAAIAEIAGQKPIDILKNVPFRPQEVTGDIKSRVKVAFSVTKGAPPGTLKWSADIGFSDLDISKPVGGSVVSDANGTIKVDQTAALITADAKLDGVPGTITMTEPVNLSGPAKRDQKIRLQLDDKTRNAVFPGLNAIFSGPMTVELGMVQGGTRPVTADLSKTQIDLSWIGWRKGAGIPAKATFDLTQKADDKSNVDIGNLVVKGEAFSVKGDLAIAKGDLQSADFSDIRLNRNDRLAVKATRNANGYRVNVRGSQFDARALIKQISGLDDKKKSGGGKKGTRVVVSAEVDAVGGFNGEAMRKVNVSYESAGTRVSGVSINATTSSGQRFVATNNDQGNARSISLQSNDAGAVLRFFDFYDKMQGGQITVGLASQGSGPLRGQIDARNFSIVNEPRLAKIVSSPPQSGGTSLNQAVKRDIDVSRVNVERGFSLIEKGDSYLTLAKGVVRGPSVGTTFQGTLYDKKGNMSITGTFMPAYGVNRLFGELPLVGVLLGNGRDRGLIGITYKLTGSAKQPQVIVNPISVIAPGIFRSIFEF